MDWHTGLQLWGSEAALRTAWSRFLNEQHSRVPELQSLSQHGDWDTALAVVHRMRGAAGNLALLRSAEVTSAAPALAPAAIAAEAGLSAAARTQVQEALQALTEALQGGEIDSEALQQLLPEAMVAALQAAIDMFGFDQALQCAQALASSVSTSSDSERKPPHAAQA
ncbi:Hpt domain-containing protein [Comamonas kerstersii]|uniref:Hpt domain-containing protein n=1 Tax=Comamonas kerstersii TaxID=225992 RepID=UPI0013B06BDB|nr:Hpt domain-containing protein [Comamonas kerstersii]